MKKMKLCTPAVLALLLIAPVCNAEVAVIINANNTDTLSADDINGIFLAKMKSFPSGSAAIPINQSSDSSATQAFNEQVLKKNSQQLKAYWSKLVFTGQGTPPKEVDNDAEVIKLVQANPSTIGYIDSSSVTAGVKVIATY